MNKKMTMVLFALALTACESVSPLRYGEKTYTPTMSQAEMNANVNNIEQIEQRARAQTKEEMMDTAEAIHKARGNSAVILY